MKKFAMLTSLMIAVVGSYVFAATKGDSPGWGQYGKVEILTTATLVFTNTSGRNAFAIVNNGPNTIWCGFDTSVLTTTGFPIFAAGALSIDMTSANVTESSLYCIATSAAQVAPANTRWIQVK